MRGSAQPAFTTHVTVCRWNLQKCTTRPGIHAASRRDTAASTHWIFLIQNSAMTASTTLLNALLQGRLHPCGLRHGSDLQGRNRRVHTGKPCLPCARLPVLNQPHSPWRHRGVLPLPQVASSDMPYGKQVATTRNRMRRRSHARTRICGHTMHEGGARLPTHWQESGLRPHFAQKRALTGDFAPKTVRQMDPLAKYDVGLDGRGATAIHAGRKNGRRPPQGRLRVPACLLFYSALLCDP